MMRRSSRGLAPLLAASLLLMSCGNKDKQPDIKPLPKDAVTVRVIALNDLHGNLEGPSGIVEIGELVRVKRGEEEVEQLKLTKVEAGGIDALATHIEALREGFEHNALVCAGDLVGASPLISGLFHDEPTIEAMNIIGLDVLGIGNHEFDEGVEELLRLKEGGCHPTDGCQGKESFEGAKFDFLAANVVKRDDDALLFPAYTVKTYDGVKVGFIGLTFEDTPSAVSPDMITSVKFLNEVETINKAVKELQGQGVKAIVVVIHEGGFQAEENGIDGCGGLSGPIREIAERVDGEVDAIVAGHTHQAFNCVIKGKTVTSAKSFGRVVTTVDLTIDRSSGQVLHKAAINRPVTRDIKLDEGMVKLINTYRALVNPLAVRVIGKITADIPREADDAGQSPMGMLVADAQLAATKDEARGGAQLALMNPGGVRSGLSFEAQGGDAKGVVTYAALHQAQPFGNTLVTMSLTGAQLKALLEQQWREGDKPRILIPSEGFTYTWDAGAPIGERVKADTLKLNGQTIQPETSYRVTVNSFLSTGGDGFATFTEGKELVGGQVDLDALVAYVEARDEIKPPSKARITRVGSAPSEGAKPPSAGAKSPHERAKSPRERAKSPRERAK